MKPRVFWILFGGILIFSFLIHVIPSWNYNFYFTMDQGANAVNAREIWYRHQILLRGPETSILGFFNGPLWYYFVAFGYFLFNGNPFGGLFLMITLNVALTGIIIWYFKKYVSENIALIIGISLQFLWWFYDTSRYSFNPFPLVTFSFLLIFFLLDVLNGKQNRYILAAIPVALLLHTELASFPAFFALYFGFGIYAFLKKKLSLLTVFDSFLVFGLFLIPHGIDELLHDFFQTNSIIKFVTFPNPVFGKVPIVEMTNYFVDLVGKSVSPQFRTPGAAIFLLASAVFVWKSNLLFQKRFVVFSLLLTFFSWIWFSSNRGWHPWHTVYIPPLIFVSALLMIFSLPRKLGIFLFVILITGQLSLFQERYREYWNVSDDPSILTNEVAAIDWVYEKAQGKGFYVYSYLPSVYDYPYQYLFWWHGRDKYGYVPCEYSSFPNSPDSFIKGKSFYTQPQRECARERYLIVEPDIHTDLRNKWLTEVRANSQLIEETQVGKIHLEKRSF